MVTSHGVPSGLIRHGSSGEIRVRARGGQAVRVELVERGEVRWERLKRQTVRDERLDEGRDEGSGLVVDGPAVELRDLGVYEEVVHAGGIN